MATKCDKNWVKMATNGTKWRQNDNKIAIKWRKNVEKMAANGKKWR